MSRQSRVGSEVSATWAISRLVASPAGAGMSLSSSALNSSTV